MFCPIYFFFCVTKFFSFFPHILLLSNRMILFAIVFFHIISFCSFSIAQFLSMFFFFCLTQFLCLQLFSLAQLFVCTSTYICAGFLLCYPVQFVSCQKTMVTNALLTFSLLCLFELFVRYILLSINLQYDRATSSQSPTYICTNLN